MAIRILYVFLTFLGTFCDCEYREPNLAYLYRGYKLSGFLEFGPIYGDKILPRKDDSSTGPISFPLNFPFFNKNISEFFINTNGIISFNKNLSTFDEISKSQNISFLSVFGSDIDTRYNGFIYHREILDYNTLKHLSEEVNKFVNMRSELSANELRENFIAQWGYLVTWHNVEPHRRYNELNNNTFQAVIFTDGAKSFCRFNYFNLAWPNEILKSNIKIGINIDTLQNLLIENNLESEFSSVKNREILSNLVSRSNLNFERGKWLFRLDKRDLKLEEPFIKLAGNIGQDLVNHHQIKTQIEDYNRVSYVLMGNQFGDSVLAKNDDGFSEVRLRGLTKFPLYADEKNIIGRLFIQTNGIISFDEEISYSGQITSESSRNKRYIAPLWSDIDTRFNGEIYYREILNFNNLTTLIKDVQGFVEISKDFTPTWAFTVSWINVEPYRNRNRSLKNTFHSIMFTNGTASYVYFHYFYLSWPNIALFKNFQVGFNFNKNLSFILKNFDYSKFSLSESQIKSEQILAELFYGTNMNQTGKWIYRLDKTGNYLKNISVAI